MTSNLQMKTVPGLLRVSATTVLRVVVAASLAAACFMVLAQAPGDESETALSPALDYGDVDLGRLERIFWICDHAAATDGVHGSAGVACGMATEELKRRMFAGDFSAMLDWWNQNKETQYEALSRSQRQAVEQQADATAQVDDYPMP